MDTILGIDHVGLGVRDMTRMTSFYADMFGLEIIASMPEGDHPAIRGLLRSPTAVHSSCLLASRAGGLTLALFRQVDPPPRPIRIDHRYGDIGVTKLRFFVADVHGPRYVRDPEGNLIELSNVSDPPGGAAPVLSAVGVAVTDLDRSLAFYRDVLGLDAMLQAPTGQFSALLDEVTGHPGTTARSCVLGSGRGKGELELVEVTKPRGRSIPFGTQWGDFGYLQLCLYATDGERLAAQAAEEKLDVVLPLQTVDDPDFPAQFMYLRDPDGIPMEVLVYPPGLQPAR
jgi:catechol 2,3-dioxygenase-like lactoylglutathione lyase family enzyme